MDNNKLIKTFISQLISFSNSIDKIINNSIDSLTIYKEKELEFYELKKFVKNNIKNNKIKDLFNEIPDKIFMSIEKDYKFLMLIRILSLLLIYRCFYSIKSPLLRRNKKQIIKHLNDLNKIAKETIIIFNNIEIQYL